MNKCYLCPTTSSVNITLCSVLTNYIYFFICYLLSVALVKLILCVEMKAKLMFFTSTCCKDNLQTRIRFAITFLNPENKWKIYLIWQEPSCCLATDLLYFCKTVFACIPVYCSKKSNKLITASFLLIFIYYETQILFFSMGTLFVTLNKDTILYYLPLILSYNLIWTF